MKIRIAFPLVAVALAAGSFGHCPVAEAQTGTDRSAGVIVLDTSGFWRMHHTLSMPVIRFGDDLTPIPPAGAEASAWAPIVADPTPDPPKDWATPDFDDSTWYRGTGASACRTPYLSRLCLRGKFMVSDPAKTGGLALALDFHGGAAVYLNGREVARKNLAAGKPGAHLLADDYPLEAFVAEDGALLNQRGETPRLLKDELSTETLRRIESRTRTIEVKLPVDLLRPGLNVVGIEIVRSPYHKVLDEHKVRQEYKSNDMTHDMSWNTCELRRVQLTAPSAEGATPQAVRPQGLQVWNSDPMATDFDLDFGTRAEPLGPMRLVGARGGAYSGKVVVGSTDPIRRLEGAPSDLESAEGGKIPASRVRIRYAVPWDNCRTSNEGNVEPTAYPVDADPLYALLDEPLAEFPIREKQPPAADRKIPPVRTIIKYGMEPFCLDLPGQPAPVFGAVVPVWTTISVPKDARAGLYRGKLTIRVEGKTLAEVPVEITVADWVVPDTDDYATWVELVQSPDVLALEYDVPLWSDRHWELIADSMKYLNEIGSRILYVPLIAHTNLGNEQSMVRWIKKGDSHYDYDFSIMEKYLDLAMKHMGKPKIVCFNVWDLYLYRAGGKAYAYVGSQTKQKADELAGKGPLVTLVDPSTEAVDTVALPPYLEPESKAMWKPLFAGLRERMKKRGLEGTMMLGMITDAWASKEQVAFMQEVGADFPWVSASHGRHDRPKAMYDIADVGYQAHAFGCDFGYTQSLRGWNGPMLNACYERWGGFPATMLSRWRGFPEYSVTGRQRGVGRIGADFWRVIRNRRGEKEGFAWARYPESGWRQLSLVTSALAPGPKHAVATARYEALREGIQDTEARIQIERALADEAAVEKLGEQLVERAKGVLAERHRAMWLSYSTLQVGPDPHHAFAGWRGCYFAGVTGYRWYLGSGWQERALKLYNLAGAVAAKLREQ